MDSEDCHSYVALQRTLVDKRIAVEVSERDSDQRLTARATNGKKTTNLPESLQTTQFFEQQSRTSQRHLQGDQGAIGAFFDAERGTWLRAEALFSVLRSSRS